MVIGLTLSLFGDEQTAVEFEGFLSAIWFGGLQILTVSCGDVN